VAGSQHVLVVDPVHEPDAAPQEAR